MAERKTTVRVQMPDGRTAEKSGYDVGISQSDEKWSSVVLEDGTEIRYRTTVVQVIRVDGEYDQDGNPAYVTRMGNVVVVNAPENLRKKK